MGTNGNLSLAAANSIINGSLSTPKADGFGMTCSDDFAAIGPGAILGTPPFKPLPEALTMPHPAVPDPAPDPDEALPVTGPATFAPGNYGNITLSSANLHLTAGTYNINSLTANTNSQITVHSGPVIINIVGDGYTVPLLLNSSILPGADNPANPYDAKQLLIKYAGTGAITVQPANGRFVGQINAPSANVTINTDYYGALIGSTVTFGNRTRLHFDRSLSATTTFAVGPDMLTSFSWKKY